MGTKIGVCAICTVSHLHQFFTMHESLILKCQDNLVSFLLVFGEDSYFIPPKILSRISIIKAEDLFTTKALSVLYLQYNAFEMCNLFRPFLLEHLLVKFDLSSCFYLDSDLFFKKNFQFKDFIDFNSDIFISPHLIPQDMDQVHSTNFKPEMELFYYGIYNSGFYGVKNTKNSKKFLKWFQTRLLTHCRNDYLNFEFVDQKWLDLVSSFFNNVFIITSPFVNIGPWNFNYRVKSRSDEIIFFHMSAYDPANDRETFSRFHFPDNEKSKEISLLLFKDYKEKMQSNIFSENNQRYGHNSFANGTKILRSDRLGFSDFSEGLNEKKISIYLIRLKRLILRMKSRCWRYF
jgi:hypothetical protein